MLGFLLAMLLAFEVVLVAVPVPASDRIDRELLELVEEIKVGFIDGRSVPDIRPSMYRDELHMHQAGARRFTRHLATRLGEIAQRRTAHRKTGIPDVEGHFAT